MAALLAAAGAAAARRAARGGGGGGGPGHRPCAGPDSGGDGAGGRGSTGVGNVGAVAVTAAGGGSAALGQGLGPHPGLGISGGGPSDVGAPSGDARAALHSFMDGGGAAARAPPYVALFQEQHMLAQMQARRGACRQQPSPVCRGFEDGCPTLLTHSPSHQTVCGVPGAGTRLRIAQHPGDLARRAAASHALSRPARAPKPALSADRRVRARRPLRSSARAFSRRARWPASPRPETPTAPA